MNLSLLNFRAQRIFPVATLLCAFLLMVAPTLSAVDNKATQSTDLSDMDWSDEAAPKETDLTNQSWDDETSVENKKTGDLSGNSWEDEEGENTGPDNDDSFMKMSKEEEAAAESRKARIHFFGFFLFIGYILGAILTGYFTRNRKLAVDYPPELLIVLHTFWPLEWLFMIFAGKKVR